MIDDDGIGIVFGLVVFLPLRDITVVYYKLTSLK